MSFALIQKVNDQQKKKEVVDVRSGDTVRVYQKIREGNKERIQMFEGVVIRTDNKTQQTSRITVRKIASGVGVEKSFLLHSPLVERVEVVRPKKLMLSLTLKQLKLKPLIKQTLLISILKHLLQTVRDVFILPVRLNYLYDTRH